MTKKHFRALADTLYNLTPCKYNDGIGSGLTESYMQWDITITAIADMCERFNPRFNRIKFVEACKEGLTKKEGLR